MFWQKIQHYFKVRRAMRALEGSERAWQAWVKQDLHYWRHRHDIWHALCMRHPLTKAHIQRLLEIGIDPNLQNWQGQVFLEEQSLPHLVQSIEAFQLLIEQTSHFPWAQWVEEESSTVFQSFLNENEDYSNRMERLWGLAIDKTQHPSDIYLPLIELIQRNLKHLAHIRQFFDHPTIPLSLQNPSDMGVRDLSVGQIKMQVHRSCDLIEKMIQKPEFQEALKKKQIESPDFSSLLEPLTAPFLEMETEQELRALSLKLHLETSLANPKQTRKIHRL